MGIQRLKIENFKSFQKMEVKFGSFNVVVGANASGKSNLVNALRFLRDLDQVGLAASIDRQDGAAAVKSMYASTSEVTLEVETDDRFYLGPVETDTLLRVDGTTYTVSFVADAQAPSILTEKFDQRWTPFHSPAEQWTSGIEAMQAGHGQMVLTTTNGRASEPDISLPPDVPIRQEDIVHWPSVEVKEAPDGGRTEARTIDKPVYQRIGRSFVRPFHPDRQGQEAIAIYDFSPRSIKDGCSLLSPVELQTDGGNLARTVQAITDDEEKERAFLNLVRDLLPFVEEVAYLRAEPIERIWVTAREAYGEEPKSVQARQLSDGTVNVLAVTAGLWFGAASTVVFEEPGRNIHPHLISRLVQSMKEASKEKQVIITTHDPEILRHCDPSDVLLVSRDSDGLSRVTRPSEKREIQIFLQNDLGLGELYAQNLLGVGSER